MPNLNGTGPRIKGGGYKRFTGGSKKCICPECGFKKNHKKGIPCSEETCPKCNSSLKGVYCI